MRDHRAVLDMPTALRPGQAERSSPPPGTRNQLVWEDLDSWVTPNERFFRVVNYQAYGPLGPALDAQAWRLEVTGQVSRTLTFTLDELKARPRRELTFTVECGGNNGTPGIQGLIGNATWARTPLAPILQEAGILEKGIEVAFWGSDVGEEVIGTTCTTAVAERSWEACHGIDGSV